jgi:hypothetical protein
LAGLEIAWGVQMVSRQGLVILLWLRCEVAQRQAVIDR